MSKADQRFDEWLTDYMRVTARAGRDIHAVTLHPSDVVAAAEEAWINRTSEIIRLKREANGWYTKYATKGSTPPYPEYMMEPYPIVEKEEKPQVVIPTMKIAEEIWAVLEKRLEPFFGVEFQKLRFQDQRSIKSLLVGDWEFLIRKLMAHVAKEYQVCVPMENLAKP